MTLDRRPPRRRPVGPAHRRDGRLFRQPRGRVRRPVRGMGRSRRGGAQQPRDRAPSLARAECSSPGVSGTPSVGGGRRSPGAGRRSPIDHRVTGPEGSPPFEAGEAALEPPPLRSARSTLHGIHATHCLDADRQPFRVGLATRGRDGWFSSTAARLPRPAVPQLQWCSKIVPSLPRDGPETRSLIDAPDVADRADAAQAYLTYGGSGGKSARSSS